MNFAITFYLFLCLLFFLLVLEGRNRLAADSQASHLNCGTNDFTLAFTPKAYAVDIEFQVGKNEYFMLRGKSHAAGRPRERRLQNAAPHRSSKRGAHFTVSATPDAELRR